MRSNLELDRARRTRRQLERSRGLLDQAQRLARVGSWEIDLRARCFEEIIEQQEAKRLLETALEEGPAHAYLFHGPAASASGRRRSRSRRSCSATTPASSAARTPTCTCSSRSATRSGSTTIRELRRDLHMRPFEADRRVYLVFGAHLLNEEAADALLKDLEEPPPYAVIVLVADELGPLPETIRSRCQLVPFRRLSERAVRTVSPRGAPALPGARATALARVAGGRLDRVERLLDRDASARREELLAVARAVYRDPAFEPRPRPRPSCALGATRREDGARRRPRRSVGGLELPDREAEQRIRRAERGAEREELLAARGARRLVPRPRGRGGRRRRPPSTSTASTSCARTAAPNALPAPNGPPRSCARPGARSRSSTSSRARAGSALRPAPPRARAAPSSPSVARRRQTCVRTPSSGRGTRVRSSASTRRRAYLIFPALLPKKRRS